MPHRTSRRHHVQGDSERRLARLLQIDHRFRTGSFSRVEEVAHDLGVTARTLHRDLDFLRDLGAPIEFDRPAGVWRYTPGQVFMLPASFLSSADMPAAVLLAETVERYRTTPLGDAMARAVAALLATLPARERHAAEWVASRVRFTGRPAAPIDPVIWRDLLEALHRQETCELLYGATAAEARRRTIDPWGVLVRDGDTFVHGYSHEHAAHRTFYLPRVRKLRLTGRRFEIPADFDLDAYAAAGFEGLGRDDAEVELVRLRFPPASAHLATERPWHETQELRRLPDGSIELSFRTAAVFAVARQVRALGDAVEVLAPDSLRVQTVATPPSGSHLASP